jgi:glycerol-3-phosphate dehydrogenase (NAD(P)+)
MDHLVINDTTRYAEMQKVTIIGAGVMGSALCWPLSDNGHEVRLVGTHLDHEIIASCKASQFHPRLKRKIPDGVIPYFIEELSEALQGIDLIISGVNSLGVHWIGKLLSVFVRPGTKILSITKGLETDQNGSLLTVPDILLSEFPVAVREEVQLAAIGGPCIAAELAGRRQSCVVVGANKLDTAERLISILATPYYHLWSTHDLTSLEICAALKNAYTMAVGMVEGILEVSGGDDATGSAMHNLAAAQFAQGCFEIRKLLNILNLPDDLAISLPGTGDYYVTCQRGRSRRLGTLLGKGMKYSAAIAEMEGETLEAALAVEQLAVALPAMQKKGMIDEKDFPMMRMLIDVIVRDKPVDMHLSEYFK